MLGRGVNEALKKAPPVYPWGDTLPILARADWRLANLECALSDRGEPWTATPKIFHFRSDLKNIEVLKAAQIDAVSLANNHVLDYGERALRDTLGVLGENNIGFAGAGADEPAAKRPFLMTRHGMKLGLVAFTDNEPAWAATAKTPGVFYAPAELTAPPTQKLLELVRQLRAAVEVLIVSAHWGSNWGYYPEAGQPALARALIDAGADIVYGHSAHVFRGLEIYRRKLIIYSAGDFLDDYAVHPAERNDETFVFEVELVGVTIKGARLYPVAIADCQAKRVHGQPAAGIAAKMAYLCEELGRRPEWNTEHDCLTLIVNF